MRQDREFIGDIILAFTDRDKDATTIVQVNSNGFSF